MVNEELKERFVDEKTGIEYVRQGDYYIPNLVLTLEGTNYKIRKYGRIKLNYLKNHKKAEYSIMLMDGTLNNHLKEIQETAITRVEQIIKQLKEKSNLTEEMKNTDVLYWVGTLNSIKAQAEEVIYNEVQEKYYLEALTVYFENVLNMLRTISCKDRIEDGQKNYTINVANNLDFAINAASSREDNSDLSFINQFSFDYIKMNDKRAESLLLLLAVFKENRNLEDYYNTIYNSDLPSFLEFFGVKSKEELETFYKIASSLNEATKIKNGDLSELLKSRNEIGYDYKVDILKISIKDLMNYLLNNQDLTLKEMLYLYNFIKSYVTYGTYTDVEKLIEPETTIKYEYDTEYLKDIYDIETIFYKFIRQYYNVSLEDIEAINKDGYYFSQIDYNSSFASELDIYKLTQKFSLLSVIRKSYTTYYDDVKEFDNNNKKVK